MNAWGIVVALLFVLVAGCAPSGSDEDHGRPVEKIAKDLGVTPEEFREAFKKVKPAQRGEQTSDSRSNFSRTIDRTECLNAEGVAEHSPGPAQRRPGFKGRMPILQPCQGCIDGTETPMFLKPLQGFEFVATTTNPAWRCADAGL